MEKIEVELGEIFEVEIKLKDKYLNDLIKGKNKIFLSINGGKALIPKDRTKLAKIIFKINQH